MNTGNLTGTPWMTTAEAAVYLRRTTACLELWRRQGCGPPYHPTDKKKGVLYHRDEVDQWLREQTRTAVAG